MRWFLILCLVASPALAQDPNVGALITWEDSHRETGYRIERRDVPSIEWSVVASVEADAVQGVDPGPLVEGEEYCWRLVAVRDHPKGPAEAVSEESCVMIEVRPPTVPVISSVEIVWPPETADAPATLATPPEEL